MSNETKPKIKYHVVMHFIRPLSEYGDMYTYIIESNESVEEIKKNIEEHHKKKKIHADSISISKFREGVFEGENIDD
jgi:hypothetical protein